MPFPKHLLLALGLFALSGSTPDPTLEADRLSVSLSLGGT